MTDRSKHPIVHFVGSIPLPDSETVFRTLSKAVGPHLIRLPDGETGIRKSWIRFLQDVLSGNSAIEFAKDVPPFKFVQWDGKLVREIPRLRVKPGATIDPASFDTGYAAMAIESWGVFERLQKAGDIPAGVKFQISIPTPIAPTYNNMVPADRQKLLAALVPHFLGEVGEDRQGAAQRPHRDPVGRLPGGAGLGELLRQGPGRFPHRDHRRADPDRRRRAGRHRARLSPVLRQPGRRAHGAAEGHGHHGRDDQRHRRGRQAADPVLPYAGGQGAHRRRLFRAAEGLEASTRRPSFISA